MAATSACSLSRSSPALLQGGSSLTRSLREQTSSFRPSLAIAPRRAARSVTFAQKQDTPLPETKVDVEMKNDSAKVFENTPAGMFMRPESERRPETGDKSVESVMKFDGVGPETVNSRLAMVGIIWALGAEVVSGQSLVEQVTKGSGFLWFLLVAPVFIWATFVPIFSRGESPDSRKAGPFNAKAERWNGRAAMIGFVSLIITEQILLQGRPLLGFLHH
ncbi:hypothetical protein L7F22_002456 [Adiantum nelumboides]|nr:hypothetical protein [Adiantum nelumboides]